MMAKKWRISWAPEGEVSLDYLTPCILGSTGPVRLMRSINPIEPHDSMQSHQDPLDSYGVYDTWALETATSLILALLGVSVVFAVVEPKQSKRSWGLADRQAGQAQLPNNPTAAVTMSWCLRQ
jgi:p-aminobenzoyl-glutamate transporter AbgT